MAAMEFHHLPLAGGLYDQSPKFVDDMIIIFEAKAEHEKREAEKKEKELGNRSGGGKGSRKMPHRGRRR